MIPRTPIRNPLRLVNVGWSSRTMMSRGQRLVFSQHVRHASRLSPVGHSNSKISTVFGALMLLGVGSTAYGIYEFYSTFSVWPEEVRSDLRAGVKAKHQDDLVLSERFLRRALETAYTLPLEKLSPEPYLKISGIASVLGEVLESNNRPQAAYEIYTSLLSKLQAAQNKTGPERLRSAAIAYKLGEMAELYQQPPEEEEKWLSFAVEELLRILRDSKHSSISSDVNQSEGSIDLSEMEIPSWVNRTDIVAPLQSLGAFYGRTGKQEYAVPLYLSALSVVMPPDSSKGSAESRCQGALIMNSLADSLVQSSATPQRREQAETWVKKALAVVEQAKKSANGDQEVLNQCDFVLISSLFNMGSLREMADDLSDARKWFTESRKRSIDMKMREGVLEADLALRRIERLSKPRIGQS